MIFFSTLSVPKMEERYQIDYQSNIVSIGSCFADNLAKKMAYHKFKIQSNPFGVLFHPLAIENVLNRCCNSIFFDDSDLFFYDELWHSFEVHSQYSNPDKSLIIKELNTKIQLFSETIPKATHLVITLGTAWVYREMEINKIVANCHKVPQQKFKKEILSTTIITKSLERIYNILKEKNPNLCIIFTISPVRHLKDGFIENQRSKANLFSALHDFLEDKNDSFYFPAYEVLMDELRDYRFYNDDLIHPSAQAITYIWGKFAQSFIHANAHSIMTEVAGIQASINHRPIHPTGKKHQLFIENLSQRIKKLQQKIPHLNFEQ